MEYNEIDNGILKIINRMFGSSIRQNGESQTPQGGFDHEKMVISSIKDGLRPAARKDGVKSNIIRPGFGCQEKSWLNHLLNPFKHMGY